MKCIINGKIILSDRVLEDCAIVFGEKIEKIVPLSDISLNDYEIIDANKNYVSAGFIDIHIHGYLGADVSDGECEGIKKIAEGIVKNGVTAWCPTTMTVSKDEILKAFDAISKVKNSNEYYGARIIGANSEGPFINPISKGAQAEEHILKPDADFILENKDIIKLFTIAPEQEGGYECVKKVTENTTICASLGHTNATYEEANLGFLAGIKNVTHLFNAMSPFNHRKPGAVGAALMNEDVYCELIADTFHISKDVFPLVTRLKKDKLCLITDCMRAGGMPDGEYTLGGQAVEKNGEKCLLKDGTIAGSVLTLNKAVNNLLKNTSLSVAQAVACATLNPAKLLGIDDEVGSIELGKRADILILDDEFNVELTIISGKVRYSKENKNV